MSNNYPELRFDAEFLQVPDMTIEADFGVVYQVENSHVLYATTATWNSQPQLIAQKGYIYIYSDWMKDEQGRDIPGMKVGNGVTYLADLIFSDQKWKDHVEDFEAHVSAADRAFWNNKVTCFPSEVEDETLIFTKE